MMKWLTIGAGTLLGGLLGWNIGTKFLGPSGTTFLALILSMLGTWLAWNMTREM